jgi:PIN domain nuclease of toxin-antitoxin system
VVYLLDTHALLWFLKDDKQLSQNALNVIETNNIKVSIATLWEIVIKTSLGKLILPAPFAVIFPQQLYINDIAIIQTSIEHLSQLNQLEFHHRDPFDRLLIAQAMVEGMTLISRDKAFKDYDVKVIW